MGFPLRKITMINLRGRIEMNDTAPNVGEHEGSIPSFHSWLLEPLTSETLAFPYVRGSKSAIKNPAAAGFLVGMRCLLLVRLVLGAPPQVDEKTGHDSDEKDAEEHDIDRGHGFGRRALRIHFAHGGQNRKRHQEENNRR